MPVSSTNTKSTFPFTPASLPNCVCWLDASDTSSYTPGTSVTAVRNKVVYGSSPAYTTGSPDPACTADSTSTTINGLTALTCNGNDNNNLQFRLPAITYTQPSRTVFFVIKDSAYYFGNSCKFASTFTTTDSTIGFGFDITNANYLGFYSENINFYCVSYAYFYPTSETSIVCWTSTVGIFANGSFLTPDSEVLGSVPTGTDSDQYVGCNISNNPLALGDVLIFDGALTDTERQQVEGYLANKWGIASQLPATHPYYSSSAAVLYRPLNRAFQPVDIDGCGLWLDAADSSSMTLDIYDSISVWNDKSGKGNHALAYNSPYLTTESGKQYVYFAGANGFNGSISITGTQVTTFVVIIIPSTPFYVNRIVSLGVTNTVDYDNPLYVASLFTYDATSDITTFRNFAAATVSNTASSTPRIVASIYDGTNGYLYLNGVASSAFSSSGSFGIEAYGIGKDVNANDEFFEGYIGEVIIYDTAVTNTQRIQIEAYLAQKWGVSSSLPTGHPGTSLRAFSTSFTPKSVGTMALWLDASDSSTITLSSGSLTAWADKSGTGYTASRYTGDAGTLTTSSTAGRTSVYTSSPRMIIRSFVWNNTFTQFIVAKATNNSITIGLSDVEFGTNYLNQYNWIYTLNGPLVIVNKTLGIVDIQYWPSPVPVANTWVILCIGFNLGTVLTHYTLNGTSRLAYTGSGSSVSAGSNTGYFTINGLSYLSDGEKYIGEILHYNRSLSVNERQQVEGYLAWKWGIQSSLPTTHPYTKSSP